jgi:hypothetical protein
MRAEAPPSRDGNLAALAVAPGLSLVDAAVDGRASVTKAPTLSSPCCLPFPPFDGFSKRRPFVFRIGNQSAADRTVPLWRAAKLRESIW